MKRRRLPTLSQLDLDNTDDYEIMQSGSRDAKAGLPVRGGPSQNLKTLPTTADTCWCGEKYPHDWPGRTEGEPHPR